MKKNNEKLLAMIACCAIMLYGGLAVAAHALLSPPNSEPVSKTAYNEAQPVSYKAGPIILDSEPIPHNIENTKVYNVLETENYNIRQESHTDELSILEAPPVYTDFDGTISYVSNASADQLNTLIDMIIESRKMTDDNVKIKNCGEVLKQIENEYKISAYVILAMTIIETEGGTTGSGIHRNNLTGIRFLNVSTNSYNYKKYDSAASSMRDTARLLSDNYRDSWGLNTVFEVGSKWSESNKWGNHVYNEAKKYSNMMKNIVK